MEGNIIVYEITNSNMNPTNTTLEDYFNNLGMKPTTDIGKTTTNQYSDGISKANYNNKYEDYLNLYNFVLNSLKDNNLKKAFKNNYEEAFNNIYGITKNNSIYFKILRDLNLVIGNSSNINNCKGYLYKFETNNKEKLFGFIIYKKNNNSKNFNVYCYIENPYVYVSNLLEININNDLLNDRKKETINKIFNIISLKLN